MFDGASPDNPVEELKESLRSLRGDLGQHANLWAAVNRHFTVLMEIFLYHEECRRVLSSLKPEDCQKLAPAIEQNKRIAHCVAEIMAAINQSR